MNSILEINSNLNPLGKPQHTYRKGKSNNSSQKGLDYYIKIAKNYAKIIDSRESTYRLALDLTAFDIPTLGASAFRNFWNFMEALWEASIGTIMVFAAPKITSLVGTIAGKFIMPKEEQKHTEHYLRFQMNELKSKGTIENAIKRIAEQEPKDQERIAELYTEMKDKENKVKHYKRKASEIRDFCNNFNFTEEKRKNIYKLKRAVILGESFIEGGVWGSFGLTLRWFRKYVLKKERFTGTMGYLSDSESAGLGEGSELNLLQKIGGIGAIFLSPILNAILLNKTKNKEVVNNSKFLSVVDNHLDMTHGVYPKLGLLFSYTSVPKWVGIFITSQGWYERLERIFKFCTIIPSWWLGHRITNGRLALSADRYLAKKYNVKPGILVEDEYLKEKKKGTGFFENLNSSCPEPARIHHVIDKTEGNKALRKEAIDLHSSTLYKGFALHSFLVWAVTMLVNHTTKLRVKHALGE